MEAADDTCANCGHASESHNAGNGKCYGCSAERRCMAFAPRGLQLVESSLQGVLLAKTDGSREIGLLAELVKKFADSDEWVVARLAELRATGEEAHARVVWAPHAIGTAFAVHVRRADGTIENSARRRAEAELGAALEKTLGGPVEFIETSWDRKGGS